MAQTPFQVNFERSEKPAKSRSDFSSRSRTFASFANHVEAASQVEEHALSARHSQFGCKPRDGSLGPVEQPCDGARIWASPNSEATASSYVPTGSGLVGA